MLNVLQRAFGLFTLLVLAACVAPEGAGRNLSSGAVAFLGGEIRAQPPAGYCIDRKASHDQADGAVVVMGKCSGTSEAVPAVITVSLGGPGSSAALQSGAQALSDYFRSAKGRAALARDGRAASVRITKAALRSGALVLQVQDRAIGSYTRAILGLKGRLVTVSVFAPEGRSITPAQGAQILDRTMAALRRANPGAAPSELANAP